MYNENTVLVSFSRNIDIAGFNWFNLKAENYIFILLKIDLLLKIGELFFFENKHSVIINNFKSCNGISCQNYMSDYFCRNICASQVIIYVYQ